jgi:hypothetical protein
MAECGGSCSGGEEGPSGGPVADSPPSSGGTMKWLKNSGKNNNDFCFVLEVPMRLFCMCAQAATQRCHTAPVRAGVGGTGGLTTRGLLLSKVAVGLGIHWVHSAGDIDRV